VTNPGYRRLARPPSDRYDADASGTSSPPSDPGGSVGRGIVLGILVGIGGAGVTTVVAGTFAVSAGLLVAAIALGWAIAAVVRLGATDHLDPGPRRFATIIITVAAIVLVQVGLWLFARAEGGVLSLPDHLAETYGILVPLQFGLGTLAAWWSTR
jgi:hypothetical protein